MGVRFEKDPKYMLVFVPERRHTDTLMARPDPKKVHRKMSKNGHYQKVRRPTGLEVYNDAAKILEQLLEKRIDKDMKAAARQRRNRTDPTRQRESTAGHNGSEVTVARCKTMPSRYRECLDDDTKKRELEAEERKEENKKIQKGAARGEESDSPAHAETDDEDPHVTTNRKKKSVFKRAKENLIRTFRRDQKDGLGKKDNDKEETTQSKKKRKVKKKASPVVRESQRNVKGYLNHDNSIDITETVDFRHSNVDPNSESHSHKSRSGSMSRNSLMDAIRKPFSFRKSLHRKENLDDDEKNKLQTENGFKSLSIKDEDSSTYPSSSPRRQTDTPTPPPPSSLPFSNYAGKRTDSSNSPRSSNSKSPPLSGTVPHDEGRGGTLSSTASTVYPNSDYNNSVGSLNGLLSAKSNVLDSPSEDIKFIDDDDDSEKRKSMIKYHGSQGLLSLQWLAEQTANAKAFDFEIDERCVSTIRPDGQMETTTTTTTTTRAVILPEVAEEGETDDHDGISQDGEDPAPVKDHMYGKIAQRLLEIADTYGDPEDRDVAAASVIEEAPLTDLEKEIIACLRSGGDKYDKQMEDQLDALKSAVTDDAYERFRITVANSMGHEVSWNALALLYHATKGVVSAVGKSSEAAVQAKEFTLKYISDTFVSWIMEQGGFDSMLSGSETDPELD